MTDGILQIDLDAVVRQRVPGVYRFVPRFLIRSLERLICQDRMNDLLRKNCHLEGVGFSQGILDSLSVRYMVEGKENLPASADSRDWRVVFVSNHPLGGLDGMILIDMIGSRAPGKRMNFIVNDLLMNIPPLRTIFLPVNTISGKQSRETAEGIDLALKTDIPVAVFPAGLCSRLVKGKIQDLDWNKMFVNKAKQYHRDIIPVHFEGQNSGFFYKFAKLREMLRIPVNLEMFLLPGQVFRNENATFTITVGKRIPWQTLEGGPKAVDTVRRIRELVYSLPHS